MKAMRRDFVPIGAEAKVVQLTEVITETVEEQIRDIVAQARASNAVLDVAAAAAAVARAHGAPAAQHEIEAVVERRGVAAGVSLLLPANTQPRSPSG